MTETAFGEVREAFAANVVERGEVGAAVAVYHHGRLVVDLWGGLADVVGGRPWQRDTTTLWMSSTKGVTSTVVHLLAQRGDLDLDAPVRDYWPEFAAEGKAEVTVAQVLAHRSGVAVLDPPHLTLRDVIAWRPLVERLAPQRPLWTPDTAHGYHAQTFGFILDEIVRRVMTGGMNLGEVFAAEVAAPLGLEFWIGLPPEREPAVAPMIPADPNEPVDERIAAMNTALTDPAAPITRALTNPVLAQEWDGVNAPEYHAAPLTSANGIGTARSMARHYAALIGEVDGIRLLKPETIANATRTRSRGEDAVLPAVDTSWALGYAKRCGLHPFPADDCFGHGGAGGSIAFADPGNGIAFAYHMTKMKLDYSIPRPQALITAVYRAVAAA